MPIKLDTYMNAGDPVDLLRYPDPSQSFDAGRAVALSWFTHTESSSHYTPEQATREYLSYLRSVIDAHAAAVVAKGGTVWQTTGALSVTLREVAVMMVAFNHVSLVSRTDRFDDVDGAELRMYVADDLPERGTYTDNPDIMSALAVRYTGRGAPAQATLLRELRAATIAARAFLVPCTDADLVPVGNGIFSFASRKLEPFTPDRVFTWKSPVDFRMDDYELTVHRDGEPDWDVMGWLDSLSDDAEVRDLIWKLPTIVLRPRMPYGKAFLLYSTMGNNGKGTLIQVLRSLVGTGNCCSLSLAEIADASKVEALVGTIAVLNDENNVGEQVRRTRELKAAITGDTFTVNKKYKDVGDIQFKGTIVQCINELPTFSDTSESMYRRLMAIPFDKNFAGIEDVRIKDDYLKRPEILRGILMLVLFLGPAYGHDVDFDHVDEPEACKRLLVRLRARRNPVKAFFDIVVENGVRTWDVLPVANLWGAYQQWFQEACPGRNPGDLQQFRVDLATASADSVTWDGTKLGSQDSIRVPKGAMDGNEPALSRYGVTSGNHANVVKGALRRL